MATRTTRSGGFFLMLGILGGLAAGVATGDPMRGLVIGTGIGVVAAVAIWLVDRRRG